MSLIILPQLLPNLRKNISLEKQSEPVGQSAIVVKELKANEFRGLS
jgi:hypothetical protein